MMERYPTHWMPGAVSSPSNSNRLAMTASSWFKYLAMETQLCSEALLDLNLNLLMPRSHLLFVLP